MNDFTGRMNEGILAQIESYIKREPVRMHTPGHKGFRTKSACFHLETELPAIGDIIDRLHVIDVTELPGLDNLHYPSDAIKRSEETFALVFGARKTFFLVNGATAGILAALLAVRMNFGKGYVLVPRNVHRSVISGLILAGLEPLFVYPEYDRRLGGYLPLAYKSVKRKLEEDFHKEIRAVLIVNPTYYGISRNLTSTCNLVHGAHIPVIVDEAHGTHFPFSNELPPSALHTGADIVIHGTHKTTPALTQTGLLHVTHGCAERFHDLSQNIEEALRLIQSSSPSYILLASLERSLEAFKDGAKWVKEGVRLGREISRRLSKIEGIYVRVPSCDSGLLHDPGKVCVDVSGLKITGRKARDFMWSRWKVAPEMVGPQDVLLLVTGSDGDETLSILEKAFKELAITFLNENHRQVALLGEPPRPVQILPLKEAFFSPARSLLISSAEGEISADTVLIYPPGSAILVPGEKIDAEVVEYIETARNLGLEVLGRGYYREESEMRVFCVECS